ncbi:hypothetical protein SEA_ANNADREAMY_119 [Streptomyces phage Annadreamy]|uniref:Uncharacterized protein n=1 Tax=Streptomyces phage Annadreamy TaxID=2250335 RepID=A0A345GTE7_9CAUD|nr:hypothetical protein HWB75_gp144 [Streptomyces phage Annadreamy]AXG66219.1 hypothetical protein SEA_ANNADREAMY_119 [Streptomyces phage Annadreamy]
MLICTVLVRIQAGEPHAQNCDKNGFGTHIITMVKVGKDEGEIVKSGGAALAARPPAWDQALMW